MRITKFDIPIVIVIFKRKKAVEVIKRIKMVKPQKIYILGDNGRTAEEKEEVKVVRKLVEEAIDWECEVIKNYSEENRGVFANIGLGAKWVFEREESAIFLEDDNLPEITFFEFSKQMLELYEKDTRVLWICGTNYLGKYNASDNSSYMFTKHLLPCGWASWGSKFNKYYDTTLELCDNEVILDRIEKQYYNKKLYSQYKESWMSEYYKTVNGERPISWDYHMDFTIKSNGFYGISPVVNQIKNIGVDEHSIHGGTSFDYVMTKRFCGMDSYELKFPLNHPEKVLPDDNYEKAIAEILLYPRKMRIKNMVGRHIRNFFNIPSNSSIKDFFKFRRIT